MTGFRSTLSAFRRGTVSGGVLHGLTRGLCALVTLVAIARCEAGAESAPPGSAAAAALSPVRYEQRLGEQLPLDAVLLDETGTPRALGSFFQDRPVVVVFGYFRCPELCSIVSDATIETLRDLRAQPGDAYRFLYVSIDPTDTPTIAAENKRTAARRFGRPGVEASCHYLTASKTTIEHLTRAAGFHFQFDPQSRQFAHAAGFLIATPSGLISRYFLGIDYSAQDVATALKRAREGKIGESVYELLLLCFHGGLVSGPHGKLIWRALQIACAGTVLGLGAGIATMLRRERRAMKAKAVSCI